MSLNGWAKRLEKDAGKYEHTLTMPDGETIKYTGEEVVEAVIAAIQQEDHRLLPYIRKLDAAAPLANLIGALEGTAGDGAEARDAERTR